MTDFSPPRIDFAKVRREALSAWWNADYSVEGLKRKEVFGAGGNKISLYDYWFDGSSTLRIVNFAGRKWTIFHLPMTDLEGNKSEKATWSAEQIEAFYAEIHRREDDGASWHRAATSLREDFRPRASFDGVVFPPKGRPTSRQDICPSYGDACFFGTVELGGVGSSTPASFRNAVFDGDVSFVGRNFERGADFDCAVFVGHCKLSNASFGGPGKFARTEFCSQADFSGCSFMGAPDFRDAIFWDRARFDDGAAHGIVLDSAEFFEKVSFRRRDFTGPVSLRKTKFHAEADFADCKFGETAYSRALFGGLADFSSKNGGQFAAEVEFDQSAFLSDVDFSGREFLRSTRFVACEFARAPQFYGATPHSSTSFSGSRFGAIIGEAPRFEKVFGKAVATRSREGDIDEIFHDPPPLGLPISAASWLFRWVPFADWLPGFARVRSMREASTKRLEDSYRTARHLFEADGELSGRFYALEMDTRRNRRDVSIVERWLLFLFSLSSGYGRHIGRALFVLLAAIGAITVVLWLALGLVAWPDIPPKFGEVFGVVWRMFLLPAPFSGPEDAKVYWMAKFIRDWPIGYRLLSGLCALITTGIAGVILVTLRRRFALK